MQPGRDYHLNGEGRQQDQPDGEGDMHRHSPAKENLKLPNKKYTDETRFEQV